MKKTLFIVTVLLLVAAFGVSAFMVGNYLLDGKKQARLPCWVPSLWRIGSRTEPTAISTRRC